MDFLFPEKSQALVIEDSTGGAKAGGLSGIPTVYWKDTTEKQDSPFATHNLTGAQSLVNFAKEWAGISTSPKNKNRKSQFSFSRFK